MQKTYCDVCKQEIKAPGTEFGGTHGDLRFAVTATGVKDVCLPCVISAINKEAYKVTKRPYRKKEVKKEVSTDANGQN